MATLTDEWKNYASASFSTGSATVTFYLQAKHSTQSVANNTTNVQTRLRYSITQGNEISGAGYKFTCTYANTVSGSGTYTFTGTNKTITSGSSTVTHSSDGTKSITIKASAYNKYWNFTKNLSATVSLPKINRLASITSAPNFTDEDNPTIKYSNPAGNSVTGLKASIYMPDNTTGLALYRDISKTGTSYTFNLTDEERERLRSNCLNSNSTTVRFFIRTIYGTTNYNSYVAKTLTIVNANPTMAYTKVENNTQAINYLGGTSADTVIKNISNVTISVTPTTYKSATVSSVIINHNGINITATESEGVYSATFDITGNTTTITTKDSRGNIVTEVWTPTVIEYQKVKQNSFSFKRVTPTSSNVRLQVDSVYYQQTFGTTDNVPTVRYKIGEEGTWVTIPNKITVDGEEVDNPAITKDLENNKLKVDYTIINAINYRDSDTFYIEVSDLLSSWTNKSKVSKGIPVFEFGDDEVQVNGDLLLADINRENVINVRDALGGGGGTTDYSLLTNKPQINGVTLSGNKSSSDLGITIPTNYVTTDTTQDITGAKTFKNIMKIQNGQGTGSLWIGGDVNANTLTNNTRHLARLSVPSYSDITLGATLLGFDSSGDTNMNVANKGSDVVSFGGMKKITNATSPMAIGFCVANTRNGTTANQKVYPLEMDSNEARFNVQPNYNGTNLATMSDIPTIPTNVSSFTNDAGYISGITSSDVTTALGYTPQEEIDIIDITSWTNNKMADVYNHSQRGELFRLKISLPDNIYYYEPMNFINESGKSVFDYIDENDNIKHIEITHNGFGNYSKTETTIEIQEKITSSNKLDYSLLDNTPTIPTVGNAKTYYGVCDTGSFTGTKQVTISNFVLESGATVIIKFTHGNDYTNTPLLQINNETAKYMKIGSNTLTYKWGANAVLTFVYDGTDFILIEPQKATSSIYGLTTLTDSVSSTSTTSSATPNSVKQAYDLADSKQDELVSGTNIKTINNTSLLGSGNITIGGGGTATDVKINGTSITSGGEADIITEGTYDSSTNKIATMSDVPTKTSDLTNDSGFITSSDLPQDSGWNNLTSSTGTWTYLRYRVIGKTVYIEGYASSLKYSGSSTTIVTEANGIPSAYRPTNSNKYCYGHCAGGRIARFVVGTGGNIVLDWTRNLSDGGTYTTANWHSFQISYMID